MLIKVVHQNYCYENPNFNFLKKYQEKVKYKGNKKIKPINKEPGTKSKA